MAIYLSVSMVLLTAIGQIFLKKGALFKERIFFNRYVFLGYSTFVIVVCLSMILMKYLPLKYFSIIVSFSYPTTVVFAGIILKEKISRQTLFACLIIVMGCFVFNF